MEWDGAGVRVGWRCGKKMGGVKLVIGRVGLG